MQKTCGGFSNVNSTYFTNIGYPGSFGGGPTCTIRIQRCNPDICQVIKFSLNKFIIIKYSTVFKPS